jgi:hypothetical protein
MSHYNVVTGGVTPITVSDLSGIDLTFGGETKLPNKKISFDIHTANGGYVVKVSHGSFKEEEMYVISDDKDLGQELGKIVTHHTLARQ